MADKKVQAATGSTKADIDIVERAMGFWEEFSNIILYTGAALFILVVGFFVYRTYIKQPKEDKAADMIFPVENLFDQMAQTNFSADSINIVLQGGNGVPGVLKIANDYGGTAAGNTAKYIAGACYLHNGDFKNAVKYLKEFSTSATQVQTAADLMIGDAYSEMKNNDDAFDYYKKAAAVNTKDEFMTPEALYKEALFAETIGKTDDAIAAYQNIKDNYPKSEHAQDMDKYLARLGVLK
jgi:tetratricopeptide (TPR) repeat protein